MFGDIVEPSIKVGSKKWYTIPVSIIAHTAIIGALIIIPLMAFDALPTPPAMMAFVAAPPPPPAQAVAPKPVEVVNPAAAPVEAPREIKPEVVVENAVKGAVGGVE